MSTNQKIADRIEELLVLYKRMDETKSLLYMDDFKLTKFDGKTPIDNVVNITGNDPAVLANAIISDLLSAKWQCKVEGDISKRQAADIEQFVNDNFDQADEVIFNRLGIESLYSWLCNHVCHRSIIGVRWISQIVNGEYTLDCLPIDMRWCPWRFGRNGLSWAAPIFFQSADEIKEEYPDADVSGKDLELRDFWDGETNEVLVGGKQIFQQLNRFKYPPFVIILPSSGFMLRDKGYIEHEAEDMFFMNKKLYKEINRSLSIEQTIGMDILTPPYEYEVEAMDSTPSRSAPKSGETKKVPKGELHRPVPRGDLNKASIAARQDIYRMKELGGVSDAELGSASLDRPGVWFAKQWEIRQKFQGARLRALAMMKSSLARMMIDQFINSEATKSLIGKTGRKNKFSPKLLGDPDNYRISFEYMISSKEMEIVNIAQAQAARGLIPDRIIVRDILKAQDPAGWERELVLQEAKKANPAIGLLEMACKYAEESSSVNDETEADMLDMQARILLHDYVMLMKERLHPQPAPAPEKTETAETGKANMQGLASMPKLLGAGGMMKGGR